MQSLTVISTLKLVLCAHNKMFPKLVVLLCTSFAFVASEFYLHPLAKTLPTLREQAELQRAWRDERVREILPRLMAEHSVDV